MRRWRGSRRPGRLKMARRKACSVFLKREVWCTRLPGMQTTNTYDDVETNIIPQESGYSRGSDDRHTSRSVRRNRPNSLIVTRWTSAAIDVPVLDVRAWISYCISPRRGYVEDWRCNGSFDDPKTGTFIDENCEHDEHALPIKETVGERRSIREKIRI